MPKIRGKTIFLVFIVLLTSTQSSTLSAQEEISSNPLPSISYSSPDARATESIAWGDMDGDGDLDLAVGNWKEPNQVYENDGAGNFFPPIALEPEEDAMDTESIAWGDMDGDGDLDLVVGNGAIFDIYQNKIGAQPNQVYENDGTGNFFPPIALESEEDAMDTQSIAWGDMDGDGDLDFAVGNRREPNQIYENKGLGNFSEFRLLESEEDAKYKYTTSIAWGDMDGDGDLDLAVANRRINQVYENLDGLGSFSAPIALESEEDARNTTSIAWGDMDGDGDLDLATGGEGFSDVVANQVYEYNEELGKFSTPVFLASGRNDRDTRSIVWGDIDSDGDLDLAVGNGGINQVYENLDGLGKFSEPIALESEEHAKDTTSVAWGDMDGDGDLDLAAGNYNNTNHVYDNDADKFSVPIDLESQENAKDTTSIAWGDMDGDGSLDLAVGNDGINQVYKYNGELGEFSAPIPLESEVHAKATTSIAWGDMDGDGDLDLAIGNKGEYNRECICFFADFNQVYENDGSGNFFAPVALESIDDAKATTSIAWGDMDGDGDLDLAVGNEYGSNQMYEYNGELGEFSAPILLESEDDAKDTTSIAWGDMDGDGDLDLVVGNQFLYHEDCQCGRSRVNQVYENDGAGKFSVPRALESDGNAMDTESIAWGDMDGDGDLDLAVGNYNNTNQVYENDGSGNFSPSSLESFDDAQATGNIAWGDMDGDGDLDLTVGNNGINQVYENDGAGKFSVPRALESDGNAKTTTSIAWGDMDGDGDLDLAVGNNGINQVYKNYQHQKIARQPVMSGIAIATKAGGASLYPTSNLFATQIIPITYMLYSIPSALKLANTVLPAQIAVEYSVGGITDESGRRWRPATATTDTVTKNLTFGTHVYNWDTLASDFFGQSENVQLRFIAYPVAPHPENIHGTYLYTNTVANSFQRPYVSTTTMPFRLRGVMAQVCDNNCDNKNFLADSVVYRLKKDQTDGGETMGPGAVQSLRSTAFRTNARGIIARPSELGDGDQLLALAPFQEDWWCEENEESNCWMRNPFTYTQNLTDTIHLYYTNAYTVTGDGIEARVRNSASGKVANRVTGFGVQQLEVSDENPLLLFDLNVALEWDASQDETYLTKLQSDLVKASEYIYNYTDGQAALGHITVTQNADNWAIADVVVQATNRLRPYAAQGGIVLTRTLDINNPKPLYFEPGHVRMGATWNRYGTPGEDQEDDWPLTLAHELAHYLFFLEDTYLGIEKDDDDGEHGGLLVPRNRCTGTIMGDMYNAENTELRFDKEEWGKKCGDTLAQISLGRTEWETILDYYPMLKEPTKRNPGPRNMPFNFTEITILDPFTYTLILEDDPELGTTTLPPATDPDAAGLNATDVPTKTVVLPPLDARPEARFDLDYAPGVSSSSSARAYLLKQRREDENGKTIITETLMDLGSPTTGQSRITVRGAAVDDRLCVVDPDRNHFGCELVQANRDILTLQQDETWRPDIRVSPVSSATVEVQVFGIEGIDETATPIYARIFQELSPTTDAQKLKRMEGPNGTSWFTTKFTSAIEIDNIEFRIPIMNGKIQLWVDEVDNMLDEPPVDKLNRARQSFVDFRIGGNPGKNPFVRWASTNQILRGPFVRWASANQIIRGPFVRWASANQILRGATVRWSRSPRLNRGAPVVSSDGQMIFFTNDPNAYNDDETVVVASAFNKDDLYTVQSTTVLPADPPGEKKLVGAAYRLIGSQSLSAAGRVVPGSISIQYFGTDTLNLGITDEDEETELQIHYYNEAEQMWEALRTSVGREVNFASARSRGAGLYALLQGKTQASVTALSTDWLYSSGESGTVTIDGQDFLAPVEIVLTDSNGVTQTVSANVVDSTLLSVTIPSGTLPPQQYQLGVVNGDGTPASTSAQLSVVPPLASSECFADLFASGMGQWQRDENGQWDVITLPDNRGYALTDSPNGNYGSAPALQQTITTTITSRPFQLDASCGPNPGVVFKHAYVLANQAGVHQDSGDVLISSDGGQSWQSLLTESGPYSGGGFYDSVTAAAAGDEWTNVPLTPVQLPLPDLPAGTELMLRFVLTADQNVADKGWVISNLSIRSTNLAPQIAALSTDWIYSQDVASTLTITGQNFLDPVQIVAMPSSGEAITLSTSAVNSNTLNVDIPSVALPPQQYTLTLINGDGVVGTNQGALSVLPPLAQDQCFADVFGSGLGQWEGTGQWDVIELADGRGFAITDSPNVDYANAVEPMAQLTTTFTSRSFTLCQPAEGIQGLTFNHAYALTDGDSAKVQISFDDGTTWDDLSEQAGPFSGSSIDAEVSAAAIDQEWTNIPLQQVEIPLDYDFGTKIRLRFALTANQDVADKGWVIADVAVQPIALAPANLEQEDEPAQQNRILLPLIEN